MRPDRAYQNKISMALPGLSTYSGISVSLKILNVKACTTIQGDHDSSLNLVFEIIKIPQSVVYNNLRARLILYSKWANPE